MVYDIPAVLAYFFNISYNNVYPSYRVLCPYHNDNNPSCVVRLNGDFKCYSCLASGDIWSLIATLAMCSKWDTLALLYPFIGVPGSLDTAHIQEQIIQDQETKIQAVNANIAMLYQIVVNDI